MKSEKTKSKKIERLRNGAEKARKSPKSFLFRNNLNKKRKQKASTNRTKNQTSNFI